MARRPPYEVRAAALRRLRDERPIEIVSVRRAALFMEHGHHGHKVTISLPRLRFLEARS